MAIRTGQYPQSSGKVPGTPYLIINKSQRIWFISSMVRIARTVAWDDFLAIDAQEPEIELFRKHELFFPIIGN